MPLSSRPSSLVSLTGAGIRVTASHTVPAAGLPPGEPRPRAPASDILFWYAKHAIHSLVAWIEAA